MGLVSLELDDIAWGDSKNDGLSIYLNIYEALINLVDQDQC